MLYLFMFDVSAIADDLHPALCVAAKLMRQTRNGFGAATGADFGMGFQWQPIG